MATYSLDTLAAVQKSVQGVRVADVGSSGGGAAAPQMMQTPEIDTSTADLLMQLGGQALQTAINNKQAEKFLEGAQRVAQGEALAEIVDEQPWYTEIFGPSSTVQGARTVAQVAQVDEYNNSIFRDMDSLQQLSPDEFGAEVRKRQLTMLTGDAAADAVIQTKMVESTGPLMRTHAKAHYAWQQGVMQTQVTNMMIQSSRSLQDANAQYRKGIITDQDYEAMKANAAGSIMPLEGQSSASYWSAVEAATVDAMSQGNHHFAGLVFSSGVLDAAPAEVRKKLVDARETYEKRTLEQVGLLEYGNAIASLQARSKAGVISAAQIARETIAINDAVRKQTGIQRDMLDRADLTKMLSSNYGKVFARAEAAADKQAAANQKALDEQRRYSQILTGYKLGVGQRLVFDGHEKREVDALFYEALQVEQNGGANWGASVVRNYNQGAEYVNPQLQADLRAGINAAKLEGYNGAPFDRSYQAFQALRNQEGGTAAAMAYFGKEDGAKMLKYDQLLRANVEPAVAYQASFGESIDTSRKISDKDLSEKLTSFVAKQQPGTISQWFGSIPTSEQAQRRLVTEVGKNYDMLTTQLNMNDDEAMKVSMELAKTRLDLLGPYVADRNPSAPSFANLIGSSDEVAGELFSQELAEQARKQGVQLPLDAPGATDDWRMFTDNWLGGPVVAARNAFNRTFGDTPSVSVLRVDQWDSEKGMPYAVYNVGVTADGKTARFALDSRKVRQKYEKSSNFTE